MDFNYEEGIAHMQALYEAHPDKKTKTSFTVGKLLIEYPGRKKPGDYRMTRNGKAHTHTDLVSFFYRKTTSNNFEKIKIALNDLYLNGLQSQDAFFNTEVKEFIFWITLQDEINYPQKNGKAGRKLCFQRFYEGALAKMGHISIDEVLRRTNNHGSRIPELLKIENIEHPDFYI